jgi:D-3-phosphoglycerate dehydrogenase
MGVRKKIVLADFHLLRESHRLDLRRWAGLGAEVAEVQCETGDQLLRAAGDAEAVVFCGTGLVFDEPTMKEFSRCTLLLRAGVGYDSVDVEAATRLGVIVANCAGFCAEEVANHALAFVLLCSQQIPLHQAAVRKGKWWNPEIPHPTQRLSERTVGIVGLGRIGAGLARKVQPLAGRVLGHDPYLPATAPAVPGVEVVSLETLLRESDLVSLHLPLNTETRGLIGKRELGLMKPSAYLINTARGPIIDQEALYQALVERRLAGAALDVLTEEPPRPQDDLLFLPNVVVTGHCAAGSPAALRELWRIATDNVALWLQGRMPETAVNPGVRPRVPLSPAG